MLGIFDEHIMEITVILISVLAMLGFSLSREIRSLFRPEVARESEKS
jgi:hypothetical protein